MTPDGFRKLALALPGAVESEHMDHPDFRVRGRIFATIKPDPAWAVVMLTPAQQAKFVKAAPATFVSVPGGWGRRGATQILLESVKPSAARDALVVAWRNRAGDEPPLIRKNRGRA